MLRCLWNNSTGATAIEYAMVASLISIAAITAFVGLGNEINAKYENVGAALKDAT